MRPRINHRWTLSPRQAAELQNELRDRIHCEDDFGDIRTVAGADIALDPKSNTGFAGVIVYTFPNLEQIERRSATGKLKFFNWRSELWWRMREALDPAHNTGICLPPNRQLLADLCTPKWEMRGSAVKVQSTKEMMKQLGRSPDFGSACVLALLDTTKWQTIIDLGHAGMKGEEYDPYADT